MTQAQLAEKIDSDQNAVSRIENLRYGKQTLTTLKKVAAAFDVALVVRFVPFSQLIDWVRGVPRIDPGLSPETLDTPDFQTEFEAGVFKDLSEQPHEAIILGEGLVQKITGADISQDNSLRELAAMAERHREQEPQAKVIPFPTERPIPTERPTAWRSSTHEASGGRAS
jgi:transcriptional regulator with XRE-family HTH domain